MNKHQIFIDVQTDNCAFTPCKEQIEQWALKALTYKTSDDYEVSICVATEETMQQLNSDYRQQDKTTNVLSFCADISNEIHTHLDTTYTLLGDIVICAAVVNLEAQQQQKSPTAHWAHMVIHGCLHLLGYDHIDDKDAELMEGIETQLLQSLNFTAPYETHNN